MPQAEATKHMNKQKKQLLSQLFKAIKDVFSEKKYREIYGQDFLSIAMKLLQRPYIARHLKPVQAMEIIYALIGWIEEDEEAMAAKLLKQLLVDPPPMLRDGLVMLDTSGQLPSFFSKTVAGFKKKVASAATGFHADILHGLNAVARLVATEAAGSLVAPGGLVDKLAPLMVDVLESLIDSGHGNGPAAARREVVQFLRLAVAVRPLDPEVLERLAECCTSPAAWARVYGGSMRQHRKPPPGQPQHLLANYSTWAYGELAAAVVCLRCAAASPASASASVSSSSSAGGGSSSGGGGAAAAAAATASSSASSPDGSSAAKRQRTGASAPYTSCPFAAVLDGLQNQPSANKIYWLQVLSSLLHTQATFGKPQAARFQNADAATVPAIVDCLAVTLANVGAGSGGLGGGGDPDTVGWVIQCLAGLCDGGKVVLTGRVKWEMVWDAVFQMLRPSSRLGRADMSRGAELLQSLLVTGSVDAGRVLTRFDPLRILGKDQNLAAWQALMITVACTAPKQLAGSIDRIFDRFMEAARADSIGGSGGGGGGSGGGGGGSCGSSSNSILGAVTAGAKAMALDAIATGMPPKGLFPARPLRPKASSELAALSAVELKVELQLARSVASLKTCFVVARTSVHINDPSTSDAGIPRWPWALAMAPVPSVAEIGVGWRPGNLQSADEIVRLLGDKCGPLLSRSFLDSAKEGNGSRTSLVDFKQSESWKNVDEGAHLCSVIDRFLFYVNRRLTVESDKGFAGQCADLDKQSQRLGNSVCEFLEHYAKSTPNQFKGGGEDQDDFQYARAVVCQLAQLVCVEGDVAGWRALGPPPPHILQSPSSPSPLTESQSHLASSRPSHMQASEASALKPLSLADSESVGLLQALKAHFTVRRECILTRASNAIASLVDIFLSHSKDGGAESDDEDAMGSDDDFAELPAQASSSSFTGASSSDVVADGIGASSDYQKLLLCCIDFQHWLRLVGCVESPLPKWCDENSAGWKFWSQLYDASIDHEDGMPLCAFFAVYKSAVPVIKLMYNHPDPRTAESEIKISLEAMEAVTGHPNFYRSDVRCEVLHAAHTFASLGKYSGTASVANDEECFSGNFLKKFYAAFCSRYGQGHDWKALKFHMLQPDERSLFATCITAFITQMQDLEWIEPVSTKERPVQILINLLCDNVCGVSIKNMRLIKLIFDALSSHPQLAKALAIELEDLLMGQLDNWDDFEDSAREKRGAAKGSMFQGGESEPDTLQKHFQQQRAIWALVTCGELVKSYPPCEDRLVITLCERGRAEDTTRTVVASIMQDLALSLGYASCATFLKERHLVNLVSHWLSICDTDTDFGLQEIEESRFGTFPFHLFHSDGGQNGGGSGSLPPDLSSMTLQSERILEHLTVFVGENVDTLLPLIVSEFVRRQEGNKEKKGEVVEYFWLDSLTSIVGFENVGALFDKHAGRVIGWTLPLAAGKAAYNTFLHTYYPKLSGLSQSQLGEIFVELVAPMVMRDTDGREQDDDDADAQQQNPYKCHIVTDVEVDVAVKWLYSQSPAAKKHKRVDRMLLSNECAAGQGILLRLSVRLSEARRPLQQSIAFRAFEHAATKILKIGENVRDSSFVGWAGFDAAFYLRDIISTLVRTITTCPHLMVESCAMLHTLVTTAMGVFPGDIGLMMPRIIGALLPYAPADQDNSSSADEKRRAEQWQRAGAEHLIEFLAFKDLGLPIHSEAADKLEEYRIKLMPFPADRKCFNRIRVGHLKLRGTLSFKDELANFIESGQQRLSAASQMLELGNLKEVLKTNKVTLMADAAVQKMIPRLVGELLSRCRLVGEDSKEVVAQCLGELGAYSLDMVALPRRYEDIRFLVGGADNNVASNTREDLIKEFESFVHERLIDMDAHIVQAAAQCLNVLLRDEGSSETLTTGPLRTRDLLWLEREEPTRIVEMIHQWSRSAKAPFSWSATWSPLAVDHDTWIKRLTHVLITPMRGSFSSSAVHNFGIDTSLEALLPLCHQRAEICEKVLPHVVLSLLRTDPEQARRKKLSFLIDKFFEEVNAATSQNNHQNQQTHPTLKKSIGTMINVVNVLRCTKVERSVSRGTAGAVKRQRTSTGGAADSTHWDSLEWLELNFLKVAGAAARCSAHFTALFYAELWCEKRSIALNALVKAQSGTEQAKCRDLLVEASRGIGEPDSIYGILHTALETRSLVQLYEHEGEWGRSMAIHDFGSHDRSQAAASSSRFANMAGASAQLQTLGIARALRAMGYEHVLGVFLDGAMSTAGAPPHFHAELAKHQFASAWRNALWDPTGLDRTLVSMRSGQLTGCAETFGVPQALCQALTSFAANDHGQLCDIVQNARRLVMKELLASSTESTSSLYPTLVQLQALVEIEEVSNNPMLDTDLESSWDLRLATTELGWDTREPILALRSVLLGVTLRRQRQGNGVAAAGSGGSSCGGGGVAAAAAGGRGGGAVARCSELLAKALADQARIGRKAGHTQAAFAAAATMDKMCADRRETEYTALLIRSQCHWERGEESLAKRMLHELLVRIDASELKHSQIHAVSLRTFGNWLAITRSETPNTILDQYLKPAVTKLEALRTAQREDHARLQKKRQTVGSAAHQTVSTTRDVGDDLAKAHLTLAQYADEQYKVKAQHDDDSWLIEAEKELAEFKAMGTAKKQKTTAQRGRQQNLQRGIAADKERRKVLETDRHGFLLTATNSYLNCLCSSDLFDMYIFRVCSLWFNAPTTNSLVTDGGGGGKMGTESELVSKIVAVAVRDGRLKSYKWLRIMYQLAARLGSNAGDPLQQALHALILQVGEDHPHHALYVLIALRNGNYKHPPKGGKKSVPPQPQPAETESQRITGARVILDQLRTNPPSASITALSRSFQVNELVDGMEKLSASYIEFADLHIDKDEKNLKVYRDRYSLAHVHNRGKMKYIQHLNKLAVVSHDLLIDPTCKYNSVPGIQEFSAEFKTAGGVNLPKIIDCKGTDGKIYKQLVKGNDDIRQDAVMQQAFNMVNGWLKHDPATRKRRLKIGTYKVVPLSQLSGVLEWCEGTQPIGQYLVRAQSKTIKSAHVRYRPMDWNTRDCRSHLASPGGKPAKTNKQKLKAYQEICSKFKPVMRRFFTEHFAEPAEWFERRLAYTRSVASSSIVGYVLGLGDRHPHNILIHNETGEITHIDLGVGFDQGKLLYVLGFSLSLLSSSLVLVLLLLLLWVSSLLLHFSNSCFLLRD